ncbi:MAG: hypothetical protein DRI56_04070 [Chloroflexota bacterium]|nr:MAG: hypothetical protein DRI56_04070 [Chloroflexota bacterium]
MSKTNPAEEKLIRNFPLRPVALAEGLFVTLVWASSFVFLKMAVDNIGPLTVAGLRYSLGFLVLLPLLVFRKTTWPISPRSWKRLFIIGFSAYTLGNGALSWGLKYIPATTGSFLMSFLPLLVLLVSAAYLNEIPTRRQIIGIIASLVGSAVFFSSGLQTGEPLGIAIVAVGLIGFVVFGIVGRDIAKVREVDTLSLTAIPLAIGGGLLLLIALPIEGLPTFMPKTWHIILVLATINTALAYIVYNHALQVLTAIEMNALLNLSPLGTAFLAWFLLGESLTVIQIVGMVIVIAGVMLVQRVQSPKGAKDESHQSC